jgi:hypothetical protein
MTQLIIQEDLLFLCARNFSSKDSVLNFVEKCTTLDMNHVDKVAGMHT